MKKKLNQLSALFLSLIIALLVFPTAAFAQGKIATDQPAALTIHYVDGETAVSNADFRIYKMADVDEFSEFTLTSDFEPYKNTVNGLADMVSMTAEEWVDCAATLKGYVVADRLTPYATGKTDSSGDLTFHDLPVGMYLVIGSRVTLDSYYTYTAVPFIVRLPVGDSATNEWDYHVTAVPKYSKEYNPPTDDDILITRKIIKVWDDEGYEALRPAEVIVQLLKDGEIYDTQTLNKENSWRYAWDCLDADYEWDVIEKPLDGYAVTIARTGITYTVSNKYVASITDADPPIRKRIIGDTPKTDSTFTFVFTAQDVSCPMPEGSTGTVKEVKITGAGTVEIGEIVFKKPGTFVYTVREKNSGVLGYIYDKTVYTMTYEVTEKDGVLSSHRTIVDHEGNNASALEFTNSYKTPGNKLPQTGMLWWPVPVLLVIGCAMLLVGFLRRRNNG